MALPKKALNLWEQVKVAAKSEGDRSRATKKIEDLTKRLNPPKIVSPPTTPNPEIKIPLPTYIPTVKKPVIPESQPPSVPQVQKSQLREVKPSPTSAAREIKATPAPPIVSAPPRKVDRPKNTFTRRKMLYFGLAGLGVGGVIVGFVGMRLMPGRLPEVTSGPKVRESVLPKVGVSELKVGQLVRVGNYGLTLLAEAKVTDGMPSGVDVGVGTVMRVVEQRVMADSFTWIRFRVCKLGETSDRQVGVQGWHVGLTVLERLEPMVVENEDSAVLVGCLMK